MSFGQIYLVGSNVLWGTCLMRGYVSPEDMSYSKTYHEVRNVLHDDMSC